MMQMHPLFAHLLKRLAAIVPALCLSAAALPLLAAMPPAEQAPPAAPPQAEPAQPVMPEQAPPPDVTDAQLEQTAEAYMAISDIQNQVQAELAGINDQEEIQRRQEAARPRMEGAVEAVGLTAGTYGRIMQAIHQNEPLRAAFIEKLEARREPVAQAQPEASPADIAAGDIAKAAAVYQAVQELNQQLQQDLGGVEDQMVIQQRVAEAEAAMHRILVEKDLELEDYNQIIQAIQQDEALFERFMEQLQ